MALTKIPSSLLDTSGGFDLQGNITLGDSEKIILGDSSDLEIYHGGTNSSILNTTGSLIIRNKADNLDIAIQTDDGSGNTTDYFRADGSTGEALLYYYGSEKLKTTSTGATVTGTLTVTGDLDITGDINSYNVTDLDVTDQTITLGAGQTEANSGGSGIIIDGSNASILWDETDGRFEMNNDLKVGNGLFFGSQDFYFYRSAADVATLRVGDSGSYKYFSFTDTGTVARFSSAAGAVSLGSGANDHLLINSSGNVGIGTDGPSSKLHIEDAITGDASQLRITNAAGATLRMGITGSGANEAAHIKTNSGENLEFHIGQAADAATPRVIFDSSGNVGIGTTNPSHELEIHSASPTVEWSDSDNNYRSQITQSGSAFYFDADAGAGGSSSMRFRINGGTEAVRISAGGNLGIGNNNPTSAKLEVKGAKTQSGGAPIGNVLIADSTSLAANTGGGITFQGVYQTGGAITGFASIEAMKETSTHNEYGGALVFKSRQDQGSMNEGMRLTSTGNVGIGNTNPSGMHSNANKLVVGTGSGDQGMSVFAGTSTGRYAFARAVGNNTDAYDGGMAYDGDRNLTFHTNANSERMRIDGSGNLLVGKTSPLTTSVGAEIRPIGFITSFRTSGAPALFARGTDDGDVVVFRKDSTTVGVIGTEGTDLTIGSGGAGFQFLESENKIRPFNVSTNSASNGVVDLGRANANFKDLYLSGAIKLGSDLDDYEEGTWTPTINSGGWSVSGVNKATYTRIGNRVTAQTYFDISGTGNSNDLRVAGLPFTCVVNGWSPSAADIDRCVFEGTYARVRSNTGHVEFFKASGSTTTGRQQLAGNNVGTGYIIFTVVYETS